MTKGYPVVFEVSIPFCYDHSMNNEQKIAEIARVLSDPLRLRILDLLKEGRLEECEAPPYSWIPGAICPADLQRMLGDISGSKLSYHLRELREAGLIQEYREGKRIYYAPVKEALYEFLGFVADRYLKD